MKENKTATAEIKLFSIVLNDWRGTYEREIGLGIVTSIPQSDGLCWVSKIENDEDGYFIIPRAECRHISKLVLSDKNIEDISIKFIEKEKKSIPIYRVKAFSRPS